MSITSVKVDRIVYDISTPNSDKTIALCLQDQHGAKLFFKMDMDSWMYQLIKAVWYRFVKLSVRNVWPS